MYNFTRSTVLFALISLIGMNSSLSASDCCNEPTHSRLYIGVFGGEVFSNASRVHQYGTAFFSERTSIGPLAIIAEGHLNKTSSGFGGLQIGYEWSRPIYSSWSIAAAGELEAFFFNDKKKGHLISEYSLS